MIVPPTEAIIHYGKELQAVLDLDDRDHEAVDVLYRERLAIYRNDVFKFEQSWDGMLASANRWNWPDWTVKAGRYRYEFSRSQVGGVLSPNVVLHVYPENH